MQKRTSILVVDDEKEILSFMRSNLVARGFDVHIAHDGAEALQLMEAKSPDLMILDILMPEVDGFEVCRRVREWSSVPIIVLSALGRDQDKVQALDLGADDYLTKPFSIDELLARVRALMRRIRGERLITQQSVPPFEFGDLRVDFENRLVFVRNVTIRLTPTEFALLRELVINSGKLLTHSMLLSRVWGPEYRTEVEYLRVFIRRLRRKIECDPDNPYYILTEPRAGYRFRTS
ncbi:MAG: response regulator transcription factor [Actinobacteria bacterium]|nr:response regulator transcription factor [Actinomycetota bacterium]